MLKRIKIDDLTLGMHIKEFCGSWLEHPFLRSRFVLDNPKDLEKIRRSSIREVWIDVSKGADVRPDVRPAEQTESEQRVDEQLLKVIREDRQKVRTPTEVEVSRAAKICTQAKKAVADMFQEARMGNAVDTMQARRMIEEISNSVTRNPGALVSLARLKTADDYTYMHSVAVCALMVSLARQLGLEEDQVRAAGMGGLMHDLGKAHTPNEILNKPGKLTDEEFAIIKKHPEQGYAMLQNSTGVHEVAFDVCLHHHEKVNGTGYPAGLKDEQISLYAKMGAVCDVYDAISSNRPYKAGWDPAESVKQMASWANGHFDPRVFQAFVKSLGIYPVGSLVRLNTGRLGVVVEQSSRSLLKPKVKVFFSTVANARIMPEVLDLSLPGYPESITDREDPAKWNFPDLSELWSGQNLTSV